MGRSQGLPTTGHDHHSITLVTSSRHRMVSSSGLATERTPLLGQATQETQFSIPSVQPSGSQDGSTSNVARSSVRQIAPDLLRGLLMVMMAEDHINVCASDQTMTA